MTMTWIAGANGTGSSNTVTFSNIPQTFTHLQLRGFVRTSNAAVYDIFYIYGYDGGGTTTNSVYHWMYGTGSGVGLGASTGNFSSVVAVVPSANAGSNVYGSAVVDILDYRNTNKNKTLKALWGWDDNNFSGAQVNVGITSGMPVALGTNAITAMTVVFNGNVATNSRIDLYGIGVSDQTGA